MPLDLEYTLYLINIIWSFFIPILLIKVFAVNAIRKSA